MFSTKYRVVALLATAIALFQASITIHVGEPPEMPPARAIPGLTAADQFPGGCVDCHINMPERNQDERISVIMADWTRQVAPEVMAKARDVAPADMQLTGVHPPLDASTDDIPGACLKCHADPKAKAPDLVALLHTIHLTGGAENHFLSIFQGECTHCHKMNATSGVWMVPGGAEK